MTSNAPSHTLNGQAKRPSFGGFSSNNLSLLLDRSKASIRGSTPDSEALASSDDEQDQFHRLHPVVSNPGPKPTRRSSWLAEAQQVPSRKASIGTSGPFSPVSPTGRGHSNSASIPWGSTIWNNESQKGPPQRLTEVLPSPTTLNSPSGAYHEDPLHNPPASREIAVDPAIPFAIPLHPTLKTYRSQSYSVGQLDPDSNTYTNHVTYGRHRNGAAYSGLHRRPSRPSMLGDNPHDTSLLGQLREVEDDEESSNDSLSGIAPLSHAPTTSSFRMEQLSRENVALRQTLAGHGVTGSTAMQLPLTTVSNRHAQLRDVVPKESEFALCEYDDFDNAQIHRKEGLDARRYSEYSTQSGTHYKFAGIPENRTLESVKKGHWQSSLGFGGVGDPPQSRRHSFADVPIQQTEIQDIASRSDAEQDISREHIDNLACPSQGENGEYDHFHSREPFQILQEQALERENLHHCDFAVSYFSRMLPATRNEGGHGARSATNLHQAYVQNQYGRPQQPVHLQHRSSQLLYIVTFKCQRADVFYVQEGTGLQVRKGDLVIVEADRGTDLGTVATDDMPWMDAKEIKENFIKDHHRWLMVFSRHTQDGTTAGPNPNGPATPPYIGGGLGSSPGQGSMNDVSTGELKPKMIKRLAQSHEIQTLREKEGAEAKAKRVCQQKVVEHRLNMEILDAEFQM